MNNWKLRALVNDDDTMDLYEANGHLGLFYTSDVSVAYVPFGDKFAHPLRTTASDDFGPVSNQVPGICNGTFTHTGSGSATVSATTLSGNGANATFQYTFLADGTLSTIVAISGGSGYLVGDKLRITTSAAHGSQVIEFRLVDGSNACLRYATLSHDRTAPSLPFAVHKFRINNSSARPVAVLDYRSSQVFPRPQDKLLDKYPDAAAAYGLRLLRSAYLGPAIRVRIPQTNEEKDIYFDGQGNLDTQAIHDFRGTYTTIRVKTWYDQSGNGNDATSSSTATSPVIVSGGDVIEVNGKPALEFDGSDDKFDIDSSDVYGQARLDAFMHYQSDDNAYVFFADPDSTNRFSFVPQDGSDTTALSGQYKNGANEPTLYVNGVSIPAVPGAGNNTRDELHTALITNGAEHSNGAVVVHQGAGTSAWTDFGISAYPQGTTYLFGGKVTEVVLYNTDQSANREDIEKDMALHSGAFQVEDAPLLDAYGGAHAAYSLRKLNSDYTGAAVRVRRASDGAELDVGFNSDGTLDESILTTWPTGAVYVKKWYDQSGNGNDLVQSTVARQPNLRNSLGTVQRVDGRMALRFDSDAFDIDSTGLDIGNLSSFIVCKYTGLTGSQMALALSGTTGNKRWYAPYVQAENFNYSYANTLSSVSTTANTDNNLHSVIAGATQTDMEAFLNGASVGTLTLATGIDSANDGIGSYAGAYFMKGFIQEVVVYSSDQSERREGIERNISNHYDL